jgi:hypothetical protein
MLRPNKDKSKKVKLTKESIQKAKGIFTYLKPYRGAYLIGWFFLVLSTSAGLLFPFLMGQLLGGGSTAAAPTSAADSVQLINLKNINTVAIVLFILFGVQNNRCRIL